MHPLDLMGGLVGLRLDEGQRFGVRVAAGSNPSIRTVIALAEAFAATARERDAIDDELCALMVTETLSTGRWTSWTRASAFR